MILTAFPVGFVAGLFGIGGGLITVPFLYYIFNSLNVFFIISDEYFSVIIQRSNIRSYTH